jgi:glycosyltransferase involved in cell wall biosynthesis
MAHPALTILVLARDSARNLERTLPNLRAVADQLVIAVDSLSTDDTPEVVRPFADRVVAFPHEAVSPDTGSAGPGLDEYVLPSCTGDWILRVDHDETLGPEWQNEALLDSILSDRWVTHARIPKRWAVGGGDRYISGRHWHPDSNLRLFRNIPSILLLPQVWHQDLQVYGEGRCLADAYLVHWSNVVGSGSGSYNGRDVDGETEANGPPTTTTA